MKYIKVTLLIADELEYETKPLGAELTDEEKAEKEIKRIISGEDEPDTIMMQYTTKVKSYHERPMYIPKNLIGYFHESVTKGLTIIDLDGNDILVKESLSDIYKMMTDGD